MSYNLQGKKYLICINVIRYDGPTRDRNGAEADEDKLIDTFKDSVKTNIYYYHDLFEPRLVQNRGKTENRKYILEIVDFMETEARTD